ncbi:acetylcholinesterase-like [Ptychodera flava]|uniref:acetylcholinesterase-like n=1 Tax=Ptychodera flava TaxID=63121 RepID=UPI00396A6AFE
MSSDYLFLSPLTNGLFQRVIMQSGNAPIKGFFGTDSHLQRRTAHALGTVLGCERETTEELMRCLRNLPSEDFKEPSDNNKAKDMIANIIGQEIGVIAFTPVVDGYFMKEDPSSIVEKMSFPNSGIDIMLGNLADEGMYFVSMVLSDMWNEPEASIKRTMYESHVNTFIPDSKMRTDPAVQEAIRLMYVNWENADFDDADYVDSLSQQLGDMYFVCPTDMSARAYAKAGFNVYKYHITHTPSKSFWPLKWMKAAHAEDIPIVFGWHFVDGMDWDVSKEEVNMILTVMKYWTNFAKTGNPNLPNEDTTLSEEEVQGKWPLFKVPGLAYKEFSLKMETKRALKAKECAFWNDFIPKLMSIKDSAEKCSPEDDESRKYAEEANINQ